MILARHFAIINVETDIVVALCSLYGDSAQPVEGYYEVEIDAHNPEIWGALYKDGKFYAI